MNLLVMLMMVVTVSAVVSMRIVECRTVMLNMMTILIHVIVISMSMMMVMMMVVLMIMMMRTRSMMHMIVSVILKIW